MLNVLILVTCGAALGLLMGPRLRCLAVWRAAITPLASIIGSGFLILGPILLVSFGAWAPLVMAGLCLVAFGFGDAVRFNILRLERTGGQRHRAETTLEIVASLVLAFAFIVSVAYYLNLLGAFALSLADLEDPVASKLITSVVYVLILLIGWTRGFGALESMEQVSVGLKLSIIAGLLIGLGWYAGDAALDGALQVNPATETGWPALAMVAGLLVTVQGFETSRYMGAEYDAKTRVRAMRLAQGIATAIYMIYILLLSYVLMPDTITLSETAIIDLMAIVAPILPLLLIAAALSAQFSAAVADTSGSGGLFFEISKGRVSASGGYALLTVIGLGLTWFASVFEIVSYASRAFAVYYMLQALIAAYGAGVARDWPRLGVFVGLVVLGAAAALFGTSVE